MDREMAFRHSKDGETVELFNHPVDEEPDHEVSKH
jgi:hypothetical protein